MDILLVSSEIAPWVQSTAVAEVVASLGKTLRQVGHSVTVVVPYSDAYELGGLLLARRLSPLRMEGHPGLTVFDTQLTSGVQLTLLASESGTNGHRSAADAAIFGRAVAAFIKDRAEVGVRTDIVHVHDWFGGLVGSALELQGDPKPPVILTVCDIERQGTLSSDAASCLGPLRDMPQLRLDGQYNILAAAVRTASFVTTLSEGHARLLGDSSYAGPLAEVVAKLEKPPLGIQGGIDYARYNPAIDPLLAARYDAEDFSQKNTCKTALQRELGLDLDLNCPLFFVPGPIAEGPGAQPLRCCLEKMLDQPLSVVIALNSTDDADMVDVATHMASQWPGRSATLNTDTAQAMHRALSAADFVLLASGNSPVETNHLLAQRYGAVPIAIAKGVFLDNLVDCDAKLDTGCAFLFGDETAEGLLGAVARAVTAFGRPEFERLRRRIMKRDMGWERPARRMLQIYQQALGTRV
jgi:starch synthase